MNFGFYHQLLVELYRFDKHADLSKTLRDSLRNSTFDNLQDVVEGLREAMVGVSATGPENLSHVKGIADAAIWFSFMRNDQATLEAMMQSLKSIQNAWKVPVSERIQWEEYVGFLGISMARNTRSISIEQFERSLDNLEWSDHDAVTTARICMAAGLVYLHELDPSKRSKARFWLQKSVREDDFSGSVAAISILAEYYVLNPSEDNLKRLDGLVQLAKAFIGRTNEKTLERLASRFLLELHLFQFIGRARQFRTSNPGKDSKSADFSKQVREWQHTIQSNGPVFPGIFEAHQFFQLGKCALDWMLEGEPKGLDEKLASIATELLDKCIEICTKTQDPFLAEKAKFLLAQLHVLEGRKHAEKELRDALTEARKSLDWASIWNWTELGVAHLVKIDPSGRKAIDLLVDTIRRGLKRTDEGGYFLVTKAILAIAPMVNEQVQRPGLGWILAELEPVFALVGEIIDELEKGHEIMGLEDFSSFQSAYLAMQPASNHHIRVYFKYQFGEIRLLRLAAMFRADEASVKMADRLLAELASPLNPLNIIMGNWDDFKDVPDEVRNKVVNKCISIMKGDLPAAADHLEFSYRNLRSYITFNEVSRLGFFLHEQQTNNKQLEQGIRLMFHDLYKSGTIFEVVFDMPKFLVDHAKDGFSSQDLEEALSIKGTTAKKYIKIMLEIEIIENDFSVGRKLFYRLRKDVVMTRFGKEQKAI